MGITAVTISDMRQFVEDMKAVPRVGDLPPIVLATLRIKMIQLAQEVGGGMVFKTALARTWGIRSATLAMKPRPEMTSLSAI